MVVTSKPRSNRSLTEFACKCLEEFALNRPKDSYTAEQKNTTVRVLAESAKQTFVVSLFGEEIFRLVTAFNRPVSLRLAFTSFYDSYGQPSSTTAERLNGLLDRLSYLGIIPHGVRIFRDQEYHTTYIGKGDEKVAIGANLFEAVYITPDSTRLAFAGFQSSIEGYEQEEA